MFKKVSYLAAVSMLATTLMSSTSHAIHEDDLVKIINKFVVKQREKLVEPKNDNVNGEKISFLTSTWNMATQSMGSILRTAGDYIRDEKSLSGTLLFDQGVKQVGNMGTLAKTTFLEVEKKEGIMSSLRKNGGNLLRWGGAKIGNKETKSLERKIRKFWLDLNEKKPEDIFTSTACALFLSTEIKGTDDIKNNFERFVDKWKSSSRTIQASDEHIYEYYVKGIIRGIVKKNQSAEVLTKNLAISLGIDLEKLSITKSITIDSIVDVPEKKTKEGVLKELRENKFSAFVKDVYELEKLKKESDEERSKLINNNNNNNEIIENNNKAIEYHINGKDDKNDKKDKNEHKENNQSNMESID